MDRQQFSDIHTQYVTLGAKLIEASSKPTQDKNVLSDLFSALQQEYIAKIFSLEKTTLTEAEAQQRNLLSGEALKQRLFRDIATQLHIEASNITNAQQLLDTLMDQQANKNADRSIPLPDIHGTLESI
jgi:hypothetical protein